MSLEQNKETVRQFFSAMKVADIATLDRVTADNFVFGAGPGKGIDKPTFLNLISNTLDVISNHTNQIDDIVAEGDKVAVRMTVTGTMSGEFMGFAPTGKSFIINEYFFLRLENGRIVDYMGVKDALGQLQQMEVIPSLDELREQQKK